jgi:hypothetical protein
MTASERDLPPDAFLTRPLRVIPSSLMLTTALPVAAPETTKIAVVEPDVAPPARPDRPWVFVAVLVAIAVATAVLRLFHQASSYELFIDEIQYADVGNSMSLGHIPRLFGDLFYLHPPLFFTYLAAVQGAPVPFMTVAFVLGLRPFVVVFAVINSFLVAEVARRLAGRRAAVVAALLYALDPFVVRFDSRVMLEAPTMAATLAGLVALLAAMKYGGSQRWGLLVLAGAMFGVAITTKSTFALVTTLPMLLMCVAPAGPKRREALLVIVVQCAVYGLYVLWAAGTTHFDDWYTQTMHGVVRATAKPQTGFTSDTAPSFVSRIMGQLAQFGPSYLLIGLAGCAIAALVVAEARTLWRAGIRHGLRAQPGSGTPARTMTWWIIGVVVAVGYTAAFGELEEQTFYLIAVPSTIVVATTLVRITPRWGTQVVAWCVVSACLVWAAQVWAVVHTTPDDAYARLAQYLAPERDKGTVVALGEYTGQFVLPGFDLVPIETADAPKGAKYALVSTSLTALGLAPISGEVESEMDKRYPVVFSADGRTVGQLRLYDLQHPLS